MTAKTLAILYSSGGLGDVGRHAVRAALDADTETVSGITVITRDSSTLLNQSRWNCGCQEDHTFTEADLARLNIVEVDVTKEDLRNHLQGVDAVVSCLGNRQIMVGDRVGKEGTDNLVKAMEQLNIQRVVVMSSAGVEEDWPPLEFFWGGALLALLFTTICRREFQDLTGVDRAVRNSSDSCLDYLIVRPVGLGEDVTPVGDYNIQKKKGEDVLGFNMAKLDCARFMVKEAINPTYHRTAVVVGNNPSSALCMKSLVIEEET